MLIYDVHLLTDCSQTFFLHCGADVAWGCIHVHVLCLYNYNTKQQMLDSTALDVLPNKQLYARLSHTIVQREYITEQVKLGTVAEHRRSPLSDHLQITSDQRIPSNQGFMKVSRRFALLLV